MPRSTLRRSALAQRKTLPRRQNYELLVVAAVFGKKCVRAVSRERCVLFVCVVHQNRVSASFRSGGLDGDENIGKP